eukprot:scaffold86606_cov32-Tisochrysis_lutea.AAC.5
MHETGIDKAHSSFKGDHVQSRLSKLRQGDQSSQLMPMSNTHPAKRGVEASHGAARKEAVSTPPGGKDPGGTSRGPMAGVAGADPEAELGPVLTGKRDALPEPVDPPI